MKLIVGLGNPGIEYQFTPHNVGFLAVDRIAEQSGVRISNRRCRALTGKAVIADQEVLLAKPETYMNLSGLSVRELVREHEIDAAQDMIVLYDELDLPLGTIRIRRARRSANGHNGVKSISGARRRMVADPHGVGKSALGMDERCKDGGKDYLLSPKRKQELAAVDEVLDTAAEAVEVMLTEGVATAMSRFNRQARQPGRRIRMSRRGSGERKMPQQRT